MSARAPGFSTQTSCLLIVDAQARLLPAIANGPALVANAIRLAKAAQILGVPVLTTEQNSRGLGPTVDAISAYQTSILHKIHFDATREAAWRDFLPVSRPDIVVVGTEAHVCVLQTVMGLLRGGHAVRLVSDAVGSRTTANQERGLQRAERYGAEPVTTEMVLFEWLENCEYPQFRNILALIK